MGVGRSVASKSVSVTIGVGAEWHCITTVDWFSVRLSLGSDGIHHCAWTGGPSWGNDTAALAGYPVAVRCRALQPILRAGARSVRRPQSDSVPAVNDGISMTFQSENRIMNSYFMGSVLSKFWGCHEHGKTDLKLYYSWVFSWDVLIICFHEISKILTVEGDVFDPERICFLPICASCLLTEGEGVNRGMQIQRSVPFFRQIWWSTKIFVQFRNHKPQRLTGNNFAET